MGFGDPCSLHRININANGDMVTGSRMGLSEVIRNLVDLDPLGKFASDGNEGSFWGAQNTFLAWYRDLDDVTKEITEIQNALNAGAASYTLQYSVKCKQNLFRTIEE